MTAAIETLRTNVAYENRFAVVYDNDVRFPSGVCGKYFRTRWKAPYGVIVVPVQGDDVILLEHYRYAELSFSIELPQGFGNEGSTPEADAARELFEETGFSADTLTPLLTTGKDFENHIFVADIAVDAIPYAGNAEDTESIRGFHRIPISKISPQLIGEMGIIDPLTICGLLAVGRY